MRVADWESRLKLAIQRHMELPSAYGVSDCYIIADDAVEAVTGKRMYSRARNYKTAKGAAKRLLAHGFQTVEDAFAAKFARVPVMLAQRGDIGVVYRGGEVIGGVFTGIGFITRDKDHMTILPFAEVTHAFKVD